MKNVPHEPSPYFLAVAITTSRMSLSNVSFPMMIPYDVCISTVFDVISRNMSLSRQTEL